MSLLISISSYSAFGKPKTEKLFLLNENIYAPYCLPYLTNILIEDATLNNLNNEHKKNIEYIQKNHHRPSLKDHIVNLRKTLNKTEIYRKEDNYKIIFNIPFQNKTYQIPYQYYCISQYPDRLNYSDILIYGPSANAAIIVAELQKLIDQDITKNNNIAITGSLTPGGASQTVGGIYEKTEAAMNSELDYLFVPGYGKEYETNYVEALRAQDDYNNARLSHSQTEIIEFFSIYDLIEKIENLESAEKKEILIEFRNELAILNKKTKLKQKIKT